ncbi:hypothetical protein COP1_040553 [Malus domestica]
MFDKQRLKEKFTVLNTGVYKGRAAEPMRPCQHVNSLHLQAGWHYMLEQEGESPHQPPTPVNGARRQAL